MKKTVVVNQNQLIRDFRWLEGLNISIKFLCTNLISMFVSKTTFYSFFFFFVSDF